MSAAWFSPELAPFFSLLSLLAVLEGLLRYAEKGTRRTLVYAIWYAALGLGGLLLAAAAFGVAVDQPRYVVSTLALTGAVIATVFGCELLRVSRLYREAELRATIASDL